MSLAIIVSQEIVLDCRLDGEQNFKDEKPFHKERSSACNEYGRPYEEGYKSKCLQNYTEGHCMIEIREEKNYCPFHPDIPECAGFLHNATNKKQREVLKDPSCAAPLVSCPNEINTERYCINTNDPEFCKTIGDLCDEDGFVKPEYPYCTNKEIKNVSASSKPEIVPPVLTGGTGSGSGSMCPDGYQRTEDGEN